MAEELDHFVDEDGRPVLVERRFVVEPTMAGFRLDHYLKRKIPRLSRTQLQTIIRTQLSGPPGRRLRPSSAVQEGDELIIRRPARPEPRCPRDIGILHQDESVLIIDKPAGLPVHASAKFYFNTLTRVLAERFPGLPLQIAHRLDRETSGALVVACGKPAAAVLKRAFAQKRARKCYLAVVAGSPEWPGDPEAPHVIDLPLALTDDADALDIRMVVKSDAPPAQTRVHVVERGAQRTLVACEPVTGRQHQIRAHLAAVGHPIVGDKLYGQPDWVFRRICDQGMDDDMLARVGAARHALHAWTITVPHPDGQRTITAEAPLPEDMRALMRAA